MKAPELIRTARLVLRRPRESDVEAIYARYSSDVEVTRFLGWPRHRSSEETRAFLRFSDDHWQRWPAGPFLIDSPEGRLLGGTGLAFESASRASTGYVLARDSWGRGYATEALGAMVTLAARLGVRELSALCHPEHAASWHVLEKCAFQREARSREAEFPNLRPGERVPAFRYVRELA